ncbi:MAG: hypothetical protein ACREVX_11185 [Clostridium sp.]|uniref:hypothetical protein n=1 Tax=Clostridium sp. TaxID=1506 RepID=UPI003D6D97D9
MSVYKKMAPYVLTAAASFYLLPLIGKSTGSFIIILVIILPLTCFVTSCVYGFKNGWNIIFPIIIGILFIFAIIIYFNSTAWVYSMGYSMISAVGVFIGKTIRKKENHG